MSWWPKRINDYIVFPTNGALDEEKSKRLNKKL